MRHFTMSYIFLFQNVTHIFSVDFDNHLLLINNTKPHNQFLEYPYINYYIK